MNVPTDPGSAIRVQLGNSEPHEISLPTGLELKDGVLARDGSTVYQGLQGAPDVTVAPIEDGARISTVIWAEGQEDSLKYAIPEGMNAQVQEDGSVELSRHEIVTTTESSVEVTAIVGHVAPAWAIDAEGNHLPTSYSVSEGQLTQAVATENAAFPIVADPSWTFTSPIQIRMRWNRAETATLANGGWGATGSSAVCAAAGAAIAGPPGAAVLAAACLAGSGSAVYTAGVAQNSSPKKCVQMHATFVPAAGTIVGVPWFSTYTGGHCR
ncbi:MAG: hypothetical protein ACTIA6_16045 [Pseudoclavibacter sp.]